MEKALISILIPVYNAENFITHILQDIIGQTYENFEVILINDGSIDQTEQICKGFACRDDRIQYFKQENLGVGAARNRAIREASTDYIMFVDADDHIDADYVEKMFLPLLDGKADLSVCDIDNIYSEPDIHSISRIRLPYGIISKTDDKNVISKIRTFSPGKIYKKSLWTDNNVEFPEADSDNKLPVFEDVCCLPLIAAYAERIVHVEGCVYHYYRENVNGLTRNANFECLYASQIELMRRFIERGLEKEYHKELRKFILGQFASANRWKLSDNEYRKMWEFIKIYFPEIALAEKYNIYAPQGIKYDVIKNVFFDRTSFTDSLYDDNTLDIEIPEQDEVDSFDYETFCYDTADKVIDELDGILRNKF